MKCDSEEVAMKRYYVVMAGALVLLLAHSQPLWSQENTDAQRCNGEMPASVESQIASCSALIGSGVFSGPTLAVIYSNRGLLWVDQQAYYKAVADFEMAISLDPSDAQNFYYRGLAKSHVGDSLGARTDFSTAAKMNPQLSIPNIGPAPPNEKPVSAEVGTSAKAMQDLSPPREKDAGKARQKDETSRSHGSVAEEGRSHGASRGGSHSGSGDRSGGGSGGGGSGSGGGGGGGGGGPAIAGAPSTGAGSGAGGGGGDNSQSGGGSGSADAIGELAKSVATLVEAITKKDKNDKNEQKTDETAQNSDQGRQGAHPAPMMKPRKPTKDLIAGLNTHPEVSPMRRRELSGQPQQARGAANQEVKRRPSNLTALRQPSWANNARSTPIDKGRVRTTAQGGDQITPSQGSRLGGIHRQHNESSPASEHGTKSRDRVHSASSIDGHPDPLHRRAHHNTGKSSTFHPHANMSDNRVISRNGHQGSGGYTSHSGPNYVRPVHSGPNSVRPAQPARVSRPTTGFAQQQYHLRHTRY
jgi:tetratricopeptide (TPR) repeat protein